MPAIARCTSIDRARGKRRGDFSSDCPGRPGVVAPACRGRAPARRRSACVRCPMRRRAVRRRRPAGGVAGRPARSRYRRRSDSSVHERRAHAPRRCPGMPARRPAPPCPDFTTPAASDCSAGSCSLSRPRAQARSTSSLPSADRQPAGPRSCGIEFGLLLRRRQPPKALASAIMRVRTTGWSASRASRGNVARSVVAGDHGESRSRFGANLRPLQGTDVTLEVMNIVRTSATSRSSTSRESTFCASESRSSTKWQTSLRTLACHPHPSSRRSSSWNWARTGPATWR